MYQVVGKGQTPFGFLEKLESYTSEKSHALPDVYEWNNKNATVSGDGFAMQNTDGEVMPVPQMAFDRLPFSHFTLLIRND